MSKRSIREKVQLYEDIRSNEELYVHCDESQPEITPAKKYAALLCGFDGLHRSRIAITSSDGKESTELSTELQPLENLREMAFSVASSKNFVVNGDTTLKDARIVAEYNNGKLPESNIDKSVIESSATPWFYKVGDFFRNALAVHKKLATERAVADAAGRTTLNRMERHVTCIPPSHVAFYLFAPMKWIDEKTGKLFEERCCINGEQCVARRFMPHPNATLTDAEILKKKAMDIINSGGTAPTFQWNKNAPRGGVILKEFLNEEERNLFQTTGQLPPEQGPCILCMRAAWTFNFFTSTLNSRVAHIGHYHPIDVKDGYKKSACLPFAKPGTSKGVTMPVRYFDPSNDYHPAILSETFVHGLVPLWRNEQMGLKQICDNALERQSSDDAAKKRIPNGYVEDGSVYFFATTRWLSPQAASMGMEPMITYVPMHSQIAAAAYQLPGEHRAWDHLIDVFVAHTYRSRSVIKTLLGPFPEVWANVRTALINKKSNPELTDMVRSLPYWISIGSPAQLSAHSIVATAFARKLLVDEVRANMAREIDHIAVEKIIRKKYTSTSTAPNPTEMPLTPIQVAIIKRRGGLRSNDPEPSSIVASKNVVRRGGNMDTKVLKPETMAAADERLKLADRHEKQSDTISVDANEQNRRVRFDSSRSTLQYHNDVMRETSEFSASCRPICRWICTQVNERHPIDDNTIIGIDLQDVSILTAIKHVQSALGDINPDLYGPGWNVRREFKSTHIDPVPEYGPCTCTRTAVRWIFPSHREMILSWLQNEPSMHFKQPLSIDTPLSFFIDTIDDTLPFAIVFESFWQLARHLRHSSCIILHDKCMAKYSIAAALVLRVRVLEKLVLMAIDVATAYPIREFIWSHNDLYSVVFPDKKSDNVLLSMTMPYGQGMLLDAVYPYDGRNNIDSNTPSLCTLLLNCGFFEQIGDLVAIRTILHAFEKMVPRACQSRESHAVTSQACIENISFAKIVMRVIKTTLMGGYPHAKYLWDDGTFLDIKRSILARRIVDRAERDILSRAEEKRVRPAFQRTETAKAAINKCIDLFGMDAVRYTLELADVFSDFVKFNAPATILGNDMIKPFSHVREKNYAETPPPPCGNIFLFFFADFNRYTKFIG